jgi:hypothetical protein
MSSKRFTPRQIISIILLEGAVRAEYVLTIIPTRLMAALFMIPPLRETWPVGPLGVDADRSNSGLATARYQENFISDDADRARARADFDEAWHIAERGPMRLPLADIHLYPARLFFHEKPYP